MWAISNSLWYLIDITASFYTLLLLLRLLLQALHANYYNPLCQFVIRLTSPVVKPLQHWFPTWRGLDTAVLIVLFAVSAIKFIFLGWLVFAKSPKILGLLVWSMGDILQGIGHLFIYLTIGRMVLSWLHNVQLAPILEVLYQLTEPTLRQVRRLIRPVGGYDMSAIFLVALLQVLVTLIVTSVEIHGQMLAFMVKMP